MSNVFSKWDTTVLVESDQILNYVNKRVLQLMGFKGAIHLFSDGKEAKAFLREHFEKLHSHPNRLGYTMVFVDDDLPEVDALDVLGLVDEVDANIGTKILPVLMVAGTAIDDRSSFGKLKTDIEVVSKPLTRSVLVELTRKRFRGEIGFGEIDLLNEEVDSL